MIATKASAGAGTCFGGPADGTRIERQPGGYCTFDLAVADCSGPTQSPASFISPAMEKVTYIWKKMNLNLYGGRNPDLVVGFWVFDDGMADEKVAWMERQLNALAVLAGWPWRMKL